MSQARLYVYIIGGTLLIGTVLTLMLLVHTGTISLPAHGG